MFKCSVVEITINDNIRGADAGTELHDIQSTAVIRYRVIAISESKGVGIVATALEVDSHIRPGENIWRAQRRPDFPDHLRLKESDCRIQSIYRRLDPDRPAWIVTAQGGGGTRTYHWAENRPLTNRELARLQGFPDDFRFVGAIQSVRSQIGMAVPPLAGRVIIDALLKTLADVNYNAVEPNLSLRERTPVIGRPRRLEAKSSAERIKVYQGISPTAN